MESVGIVRKAAEEMRFQPVQQHRDVQDISSSTVKWAERYLLALTEADLARARAIQVGELADYTFSREPSEVVQLGADLVTWLFLFDDAVGEAPWGMTEAEHRETLFGYERVIRDRALPRRGTGFHVALLEWVRRASALGATDDWCDRFAHDMGDYFLGCVAETRYRREGRSPSVEEYRALRRQTVGTSPVFAVIELGQSGVVPRSEMRRLDVREARGIAALLTAWVNDVYSFPKELAAKDPLNLVAALAAEHQCGVSRALSRAVEIYNQDLRELERVAADVRRTNPSPALRSYLDGLLDWVHGNRVWTCLCGRYL